MLFRINVRPNFAVSVCAILSLFFGDRAAAISLYTEADAFISTIAGNCSDTGQAASASCTVIDPTSKVVIDSTARADIYTGTGGKTSVSSGAFYALTNNADALYYILVSGPENVNVPLTVSGEAMAKDVPFSNLAFDAYSVIEDNGQDGLTAFSVVFPSHASECDVLNSNNDFQHCAEAGSFSYNFTIQSNTLTLISLSSHVNGTFASASLDPLLAINSSFAQASDFTIFTNPGIFSTTTPDSSVPEPSSIALAVAGILGLVVCIRKRALNVG